MTSEELKVEIIAAGKKAVKELIRVAKEDIIKPDPEDENINLANDFDNKVETKQGFAERRSR